MIQMNCTRQERDLIEEIGIAVSDLMNAKEWEDTPFRSSDDVVLLSYGFKYQNIHCMYGKDPQGNDWVVRLEHSVPQWTRNGRKIGGLPYNTVVNMLGGNHGKAGQVAQ